HQKDPQWNWHYEFAFGRRPAEELYDLAKDPDQVRNVAAEPAYANAKKELAERLQKLLVDAGDPRVTGDGKTFDQPPFTDLPAPAEKAKKKKAAK
ncbi:MAG TPA: sulfatase, partial [Pirellulaceae bacterium]|nr:sulfatase [Pirellulaceae bacterium]